jgi:uncharacterized membrane protein YhfC
MDPVVLSNLILTIIILILGIWAYIAVKSRSMLYIGIAFGFFAVTHLLSMLGLGASLSTFILILRIIAYIIVMYAIYIIIAKKKGA